MNDRAYLRQRARAELRGLIEMPHAAVSAMSADEVGRALGIRHDGLKQRLVRSRRLAPRIAHLLISKNMLDPQRLVPSLPEPPRVEEEAPDNLPLLSIPVGDSQIAPAPQAQRLALSPDLLRETVRRAGLAVAVRAMGGMLVKDDYVRLVTEHGDVAVAFALMIRAKAPALKLKSHSQAPQALAIYGESCLLALAQQDRAYETLTSILDAGRALHMSEDAAAQAALVARRAIASVLEATGDPA